MSNSFGKKFKLTSFGESHGPAVGGIIEGCPPGMELSIEKIQQELNRRRPGQSDISTPRSEDDKLEILSGLFRGKTTGMPIGFMVRNLNADSSDYERVKDIYRPSHADFSWKQKYGIHDYRGGGRSSAREHISRVVGGAIAKQILEIHNIEIYAYTSRIGDITMPDAYPIDPEKIESNAVRCPDPATAQEMITYLKKLKAEGDTIGGVVTCVIKNLPAGLGEPVFDKLQAQLAYAMMSINAAKGFEYGAGFGAVNMKGSECNDPFVTEGGKIVTKTNHSGGIQGGISNGADIYFNVAFKPVSSIRKKQKTVNDAGEEVEFELKGRHDVCVVPRAVPVVEAMAAMVIADKSEFL
ncbi:chorismate synthase [Odoribacter sp. OttesenSCG-928-G04]|nr:chorismate synthase [Odoribacter sp. OttesenSCG-928-G04]